MKEQQNQIGKKEEEKKEVAVLEEEGKVKDKGRERRRK